MYIMCRHCGKTTEVIPDFDWDNVGNSTSDIVPRKKPKYCPMCGSKL